MAKTAFNRSNILTFEERQEAAIKCLNLIEDEMESLSPKDRNFVIEMGDKVHTSGASERQLAWLRDICGKLGY